MKNRVMDGIVFGEGIFQKIVIFDLCEISFTTENTEGTEGGNQEFFNSSTMGCPTCSGLRED